MKKYVLLIILLFSLPLYNFAGDSLFYELKEAENDKDKAWILNRISDYYLDVNLDSARYYADSAMKIGKKMSDFRTISDSWVNIGNSFYFEGKLDTALVKYKNSFNAIKKTSDFDEIAAAHNRLGLMYEAKGEMAKATSYYYTAITYYELSNNTTGIAEVANNLGIINNHFEQLDIALDYYKKSLDLFRKSNEKTGEAQVLNNIATLYTEKSEIDTALKYLVSAVEILKSLNKPTDIATTYMNIGTIYFDKNIPDSALHYFNLSEKYFSKQGNKRGIASLYYYLSEFYLSHNETEKAIEYALKSTKLRKEIGNRRSLADSRKLIADIYSKKNNYKKALKNYKIYQQLNDSISQENMQLKFSELQLKYKTAKKDKAILELKKKSQARRNFNTILIIAFSALVIISILLFYSFKTKSRLLKSNKKYFEQQQKLDKLDLQRREAENRLLEEEVKRKEESMQLEKEKYESEIEHKSREILTSAMHIVNKNKVLASIRDSLDNISLNADASFRQKARNLCAEIDRNIHVDTDWEQFKMHFEEVNTGFFEKLEKDFPNLSKSDMKVCAYLKINLSTKEIAQIMNVSPSAVHKRFYRLRKKMNLEPNTNLTKFFMSY